jgi:hypothetical protein
VAATLWERSGCRSGGRSVTQIGTASTPPGIALGLLASMDGLPAMLHFGAKERMMHLSLWRLFRPRQGHAAGPAARVNFEHVLLQHAVLEVPVAQPDDKGLDPMNHRPPAREQEPRPPGGTRHQRLLVSVQNEHHDGCLLSVPLRDPLRGGLTRLGRRSQAAPLANVPPACWVQHTARYPERAFNAGRQGQELRRRSWVS